MSPQLDEFIWQHRLDAPAAIALSAKKHPEIPVAYAAGQIECLQKARTKIPAWYREGIRFFSALSLEQASSEATARFKAGLVKGEKMADLSGGMGVDSFFFAQQFGQVTHVEPQAELSAVTARNFEQLGVFNVRCAVATAEEFLQKTTENFDLLYLDPSRRNEQKNRVLRLEDCSPNILSIKTLLLEKAPLVLLKTAPLLDIQLAMRQLETVARVWVVASGAECREVLYLLRREAVPVDEVPVEAVQLDKSGDAQAFTFTFQEEKTAVAPLSLPQQYLYEPHAAILKAGAFRSYAAHFGLKKLHANTHLYTSAQHEPGVPGRAFQIENLCKYDRKAVRSAVPGGKANVAVRNFPDSADAVRKKLGLSDGGDTYLFAFTDLEDKKMIAVCRKV